MELILVTAFIILLAFSWRIILSLLGLRPRARQIRGLAEKYERLDHFLQLFSDRYLFYPGYDRDLDYYTFTQRYLSEFVGNPPVPTKIEDKKITLSVEKAFDTSDKELREIVDWQLPPFYLRETNA